ncbi:MAG: GatB/YqeY domain-containing protein [Actinomycetota bacterium]|nr:GatB/YqeY domain-containing protein [Actinomycetota bacterium]
MTDPTLKAKIRSEMTTAMKAGDKIRVGALRMLLSSITNLEKELMVQELPDDQIREVAGKEVKKRAESIEAFDAAGRTELADKERAEREVLAVYAPAQLSDEAVAGLVDEAMAATGASSVKELGKVMGFVMGKAKGQVDGAVVQHMVRERLDE